MHEARKILMNVRLVRVCFAAASNSSSISTNFSLAPFTVLVYLIGRRTYFPEVGEKCVIQLFCFVSNPEIYSF